jgi:uncharacterized protein with ParB-like and HNH nuclease domain
MAILIYDKVFSKTNISTTHIVNFTIADLLADDASVGDRAYFVDFEVILSSGNKLQRELVLTLEQQQELILSILKCQKLPVFHILIDKVPNANNARYFRIIDGKQRLSTIKSFINNEFPLNIHNELYYFKDFDTTAHYKLMSYSLDCNIKYKNYYDGAEIIDDKYLIDWFYLVNFAGTQQDKEHLDKLYNSIIK